MPKSKLMEQWESEDPEFKGYREKRKREAIEMLKKMSSAPAERLKQDFDGKSDEYAKQLKDQYDITDQDLQPPPPFKPSDVIESTPEELAKYDEEQRKLHLGPGFGTPNWPRVQGMVTPKK